MADPDGKGVAKEWTPEWLQKAWNVVLAFGRFRAIIAIVGCVGFVFGLRIAWHSNSATTLLVASAVLVLAAMLLGHGDDAETSPSERGFPRRTYPAWRILT